MNHFPCLTIIVVLPLFSGCLIFFLPHRGNRVIRWYTICMCILELLLTTYAFCYHFQSDDPLIQLMEDYTWINFLGFHWSLGIDGLSIGPILLTGFITTLATLAAWPVTRDYRLFHFLMLAMYSGQIGLFSSRDLFTFFPHVGVRINSRLSTCIHVGRKKTPVLRYKIYFVHGGGFYFSFNGSSGYRFIWFYRTNIKFRNINKSVLSRSPGNNILYWIFSCFCCQIANHTPTYMVTRYPWRGTLKYLYASSRNLIKNGSIWISSDKYGIISPRSFSIFSLVNNSRRNANNLCSFNISRSTKFKKKNSLFLCISYGFHNYRNWFYHGYGAQRSPFTNNLSWIYWCCAFFLGRNNLRKNTSCLSRRNGWNSYPNAKNIHDVQQLFDGLPCITRHEWFCCRINSLFWTNYKFKICFNDKTPNYFCNGNWNDINSYLFIIYVTSDVLWIQDLKWPKLLFFRFWAARVISFDLYFFARIRYWYVSRFRSFTIS
uniref:NADH-plastoquinone oxidoreductase subunit 4 n=1 Tax=Teucrium mascatense TaxID=2172029 RepID=A0A4Y6I5A8_9LAMI|nr:NADH-plastoquinone oxidoreductase subunit 4 [Teucrium mascatense]QDF64497.1 NADH-plastoquinone oxidoreductase subunit 4 [Teucrium mascatense]